jgi:hypothetical protein
MTKHQYRAALTKLDISIVGAGKYFGLSRRQSQRIAAGDAPVPKLMADMLHLMLVGKLTKEDLL